MTLHRLSIKKTNTKSLKDMKHPLTLTELCSFLGMSIVYLGFVRNSSLIAAPLNGILKTGQQLKLPSLDNDKEFAFKTVMEAIPSAPILSLPRPGCLAHCKQTHNTINPELYSFRLTQWRAYSP